MKADPRQTVWLYQQAVEMGSLSALCNLGVCYEDGIGTAPDPKQAVEHYRRAADYGSARAQRLLSHCYEQGIGVDVVTPLSSSALPIASPRSFPSPIGGNTKLHAAILSLDK